MRNLAVLSCLSLLALAAGCSQPWTVIRQSGPSPALLGAGPLTISWDISELELDGDSVEDAMASLSPTDRSRLDAALRDMRSTYMGELEAQLPVRVGAASGAPGPDEVRIHARVLELERGARGPVGGATELVMQVDWLAGGEVVDAIRIERAEPPTMQRPTVAERMRLLAAEAAQITAGFYESEQDRD